MSANDETGLDTGLLSVLTIVGLLLAVIVLSAPLALCCYKRNRTREENERTGLLKTLQTPTSDKYSEVAQRNPSCKAHDGAQQSKDERLVQIKKKYSKKFLGDTPSQQPAGEHESSHPKTDFGQRMSKNKEALGERKEKLSKMDQMASEMNSQASNFANLAEQFANKEEHKSKKGASKNATRECTDTPKKHRGMKTKRSKK